MASFTAKKVSAEEDVAEGVKALLHYAAIHDYDVRCGDVSQAYLCADIGDTVWVEQPQGHAERDSSWC